MTAARGKGTRWETAIVDYLRANGVPHAERRARNGAKDRGDLSGIPGLVVEAKNTRTFALAAWVDEAEVERANDNAELGLVWHHRRGKGSPADGYVTMTGATLVALLRAAGYIAETPGRPMGKLTVGDPREAAGPDPADAPIPDRDHHAATRAATLAATKGS